MASGAFRRAPKGFCDLPEVPDVPDRRADAIRALLGGADGDVMAEAILARYREVGLEEGDEDAIAEETLRILLQAVCDEIIAALKPDVSSLCAERLAHSPVRQMQVLGRLHRGAHAQRAGPRRDRPTRAQPSRGGRARPPAAAPCRRRWHVAPALCQRHPRAARRLSRWAAGARGGGGGRRGTEPQRRAASGRPRARDDPRLLPQRQPRLHQPSRRVPQPEAEARRGRRLVARARRPDDRQETAHALAAGPGAGGAVLLQARLHAAGHDRVCRAAAPRLRCGDDVRRAANKVMHREGRIHPI